MYFPLILLQNILGYLNRLWLVVLVIELPRVALVALKGSIGVVVAHNGYLSTETVIIGNPIANLKFFTQHIYPSTNS